MRAASSSYVQPSRCFSTMSSRSPASSRSSARRRSWSASLDSPGSGAAASIKHGDAALRGARTVLETPIAQQDVKPRVELARDVEAVEVAKRVEKGVLRRVGGIGIVAGQDPGMRQRAPLITLHDVSEGVGLALPAASDRVGIVHGLSLTIRRRARVFTEGQQLRAGLH